MRFTYETTDENKNLHIALCSVPRNVVIITKQSNIRTLIRTQSVELPQLWALTTEITCTYLYICFLFGKNLMIIFYAI